MKVYIALGLIDYEGETILGVFSTKDLAREFLQNTYPKTKNRGSGRYYFGSYDDVEVEEWDVTQEVGASIYDA